jgi:hypothetical protein
MRRVGVRLILAATVACTLAGCAADVTTGGSPTSSATSPVFAATDDGWVAVFGSADDPSRLDPQRKRILAALGDVLEGSVVVSPGACLQGLPEDLVDGYVLAIQRASREEVDALAGQLREEPSFVGSVTVVCTD